MSICQERNHKKKFIKNIYTLTWNFLKYYSPVPIDHWQCFLNVFTPPGIWHQGCLDTPSKLLGSPYLCWNNVLSGCFWIEETKRSPREPNENHKWLEQHFHVMFGQLGIFYAPPKYKFWIWFHFCKPHGSYQKFSDLFSLTLNLITPRC